MSMNLSSQGLNFLGLTAKKFAPTGASNSTLNSIQEKFTSYEQTGNAFANINMALENLKAINCEPYCIINGKKIPISSKSWDRGGPLEGKMPLEEGIAKGHYHIENLDNKVENVDLDEVLEELKKQVSIGTQVSKNTEKVEDTSDDDASMKKFKDKLHLKKQPTMGFLS